MDNRQTSPIPRILRTLGVLVYAASFVAPATTNLWNAQANQQWFWGAYMFCLGLFFFWAVWSTFAWWANVLFWVALCCPPEVGCVWSFVAGLLALSFYFVGWQEGQSLPLPYFLWVGSMFLYSLGFPTEKEKRNPNRNSYRRHYSDR